MNKFQYQKYPKAVVWDFDGVIANTIPLHIEATQQVLEKHNLVFKLNQMLSLVGRKDHEVFYRLILDQKPDISKDDLESLFEEKKEKYKGLLDQKKVPIYPGVETWINYFQDNRVRQAIASSTDHENINKVLVQSNLLSPFETIVTGNLVADGKPAPDIYILASHRLAVEPIDCLVIEDSVLGIQSAKSAKMRCIAVPHTQPPELLNAADMILSSFEDYHPEDIFHSK